MKSLIPFALLSAFSFGLLVTQWSPQEDAYACGDYASLTAPLTKTDVTLAVSLLETQVADGIAKMQSNELTRQQRNRRLFSRAAPRGLLSTTPAVVVVSYQAPRVGDRVPALAKSKMVTGHVTIKAPNVARKQVPYRVDLTMKRVELLQGDKWVAAGEWQRTPQLATGPKSVSKATGVRSQK